MLRNLCQKLHASDYVYYCIFYAHKIFANVLLVPYLEALETETCRDILNTFGLKEDEKQNWQIGFWERLFSDKLKQYLESVLNAEDMDKIKYRIYVKISNHMTSFRNKRMLKTSMIIV